MEALNITDINSFQYRPGDKQEVAWFQSTKLAIEISVDRPKIYKGPITHARVLARVAKGMRK